MAWMDELSCLKQSHLMGYKVTVFVFQNVFYRGDGLLTMNISKAVNLNQSALLEAKGLYLLY